MFEEMTYEHIMDLMMENMPSGIDTSEGSLLYNACAKQAVRLEEAYEQLAGIERNMYADTADLEHLIRLGNDRGCYINQATFSEFIAQFNCEIPIGSRFNADDHNYTVFGFVYDEEHKYRIGCEESGSEPNNLLVDLEPIEYIEGFEWGKIIECINEGKDQEDEESYRQRLLNTYNYRGFAGNRAYYTSRIGELDGVRGCKLKRVNAPSDNVMITIIGEDYRKPTDDVITYIQTTVDPVENSGEGDGLAPIGHRAKIIGVNETTVNIETVITYDTGFEYADLSSYIEEAVEKYLLGLRQTWITSDTIVVRILQIESAIVGINGVVDVSGTKINGAESNLIISDGSVPIKGAIVCS